MAVELNAEPRVDKLPAQDTEVDLTVRLAPTSDASSLENTISRSRRILRSMIQQETPMDAIVNFLENPNLNPDEAHNLQYLVTSQLQFSVVSSAESGTLCRWLSRQVALGLVTPAEILSILETIVCHDDEAFTTVQPDSLYKAVFEGITLSNVYIHWKTPLFQAFQTFLMSIPAGALSWAIQNLGVEIVRSLPTNIDSLEKRSMYFFLRSLSSFVAGYGASDQAPTSDVAALLDLLQHMPRHWLLVCVRQQVPQVFKSLLALDGGASACLDHINQLGKSSFVTDLLPHFESAIAQEESAALAMYLQPLDHKAKCVFLLRYWYQTASGLIHTEDRSYFSTLEARFEQTTHEHPNRSPFISLLASLRDLDYYFSAKSQSRLFSLLRSLDMSGTILVLIAVSRLTKKSRLRTHVRFQFDPQVVKEEILYHLSIGKERIAYKIFRSYHCLPIEHVPELAEVLISRPHMHPDAALRHRRFRQKWLGRTKAFPRDRVFLENLRVETLNRMALAYAKAPHLHRRLAFKKVHDCYIELRREHLPLTSGMTRAMCHAGVFRYLQAGEWASTNSFMWILKHVREVEGDEVADKLDRMLWDWRGEVLDRRRIARERGRGEPRSSVMNSVWKLWNMTGQKGRPNWYYWRKYDGE